MVQPYKITHTTTACKYPVFFLERLDFQMAHNLYNSSCFTVAYIGIAFSRCDVVIERLNFSCRNIHSSVGYKPMLNV